MTTGQWLTSGGLLTLGGLAGFYAGYVVRGSHKAEVAERVANRNHNQLGEHERKLGDLAGRVEQLERAA